MEIVDSLAASKKKTGPKIHLPLGFMMLESMYWLIFFETVRDIKISHLSMDVNDFLSYSVKFFYNFIYSFLHRKNCVG